MSEIITNKLTGKTAADDITITNGSVTQKLQAALSHTNLFYDQQNTDVEMSLNVSSVSDDSTGNFTLNNTNNHETAKLFISHMGCEEWYDNGGQGQSIINNAATSSSCQYRHWENNTARDTQYLTVTQMGDLA